MNNFANRSVKDELAVWKKKYQNKEQELENMNSYAENQRQDLLSSIETHLKELHIFHE